MSNLEVGVRLTADGRGLVGEAGRAREALGGLGGEQRKAATESAAYTTQINQQNSALASLKTQVLAVGAAYVSFNAAIGGAKAVIDAALAQERLNNTLKVGLGSQQAATQEIKFLREEADKLGLQFASTAQQYAKLTAASKGTALQGQATRDIFLSVAKASTVMGLSADQSGRVLTAIEQMISKGTVSAEELRGQMGEELPGAFQIAARAMNVTTQELGEMLQRGEVLAEDLLPKMAIELEKTVGPEVLAAAQGLNAQINRLDNSFTDLKLTVGQSGLVNLFSEGVIAATQFIGVMDSVITKLQSIPGVNTATRAAFGRSGLWSMIFGKDAKAEQAEIQQTTAALKQAEEVISKIITPSAKPQVPAEFAAALKREAEERKKLADQVIRDAQRAAKAREDEEKRAVDSANRIIDSLRRETAEIGLNNIQKRLLTASTEAAKAPTQELAQEIMASAQAWAQATQAEEAALAENKKLQEAATARAKAETDAARQVQQEWNQMWSTVENTARTSFTQFAAHGVSAMESIGRSIQNGIIDLLYQLTLRPFIINLGASLGLSGGGVGGAAGAGLSALNLASLGSGALNLVRGGFGATGLLSSVGSTLPGAAGSFFAGMGISGTQAAAAAGAQTLWGASGLGVAASLGSSVASFAGPAIAIAAVDQITRLLAGDKKIGGTAGDVLNYVPVLGPLINGLFGRGPLKQRSTTLSGNIGADGFIDGYLNTDFRAKGGLFRSNKNDFARVDAVTGEITTDNNKLLEYANQLATVARDTVGLINDTTAQVSRSLKQIGADLGLSTEGLDNFSYSLNLVSEKGQMLADQQIAEEIAAISDELAHSLMPELDNFAKRGETAVQTISRIGLEFSALVEGASVVRGLSGSDSRAFINSVDIADRTAFIDAAGGIDAFSQKINQFFGNLDDSDKLTILEDRLQTALTTIGVNFIPTMDQFNAAMRSGQLSTEQFIAGLDLQGLIQQVNELRVSTADAQNSVDTLTVKEIDLAKAREGSARAAEKAARREAQQNVINLDEERKRRSTEYDIKSAEERAAKERELLKLRFDNERSALDDARQRSQEITSFVSSLRRSAASVSPFGFVESGNILQAAIGRVANGEDFQNIITDRVQSAVDASRNINDRLYSSYADFARARGEAASRINELASLGEGQLTTAGQTLEQLQQQTVLLQKTYDVLNRRIDSGLEFDKSLAGQSVSGAFLTPGGTAKREAVSKAQRQIYILNNDLEPDPQAILQARLQLISASATPESVYGGGKLTQDVQDLITELKKLITEQFRTNQMLKRVSGEGDALKTRQVT